MGTPGRVLGPGTLGWQRVEPLQLQSCQSGRNDPAWMGDRGHTVAIVRSQWLCPTAKGAPGFAILAVMRDGQGTRGPFAFLMSRL
jgi:hypothetical protein